MNKNFFGLLIAGMVVSSTCYAMESDAESSSSESESLPARDVQTDDILVYIQNQYVARLVINSALSGVQEGTDAWLREQIKRPSSIEANYEFVEERKCAIKLCKMLEGMTKEWSTRPTIVPMPVSETGIYIRFKTEGRLNSARALKKSLRSPYITKVVYDHVDAAIAYARGGRPVHEISTDEKDIPAAPCMDSVALDATSSDFLVYIGAPQAADYVRSVIGSRFGLNVSAFRRDLCKGHRITETENVLEQFSHVLQLVGVIEKMIKRFDAQYSIVPMPKKETGMYLRFHCAVPQSICRVADMLKESLYVTRIIPNAGDEYLTCEREKLASPSSLSDDDVESLMQCLFVQAVRQGKVSAECRQQ